MFHAGRKSQCSFVCPHPSVSDFAGRHSGNGPSKIPTKTQTTPDSCILQGKEKLRPKSSFPGRKDSEHGLRVWGVWGVRVDEEAPKRKSASCNHSVVKDTEKKILEEVIVLTTCLTRQLVGNPRNTKVAQK